MKSREHACRNIADKKFDLCVIGGGATGSGCALDSQLRGLTTALVDAGDFAGATSSTSTKIVHGGMRYLEEAFPLQIVDATGPRSRALEEKIIASCCAVKSGLKLCDDLLFRAVLFKTGAAGDVLALIAHHLIVDGFSWRILLEDLRSAYCALREERTPELQAVRQPPPDQAAARRREPAA